MEPQKHQNVVEEKNIVKYNCRACNSACKLILPAEALEQFGQQMMDSKKSSDKLECCTYFVGFLCCMVSSSSLHANELTSL
jgi:hypothetical protein